MKGNLWRKVLFRAAMLVAVSAAVDAHGFTVDADLPAGNILVECVDGDTVRVRQDLRDSNEWFYWAFRVKGAAGRTMKFDFTDKYGGGPVGVRGPVVSTAAEERRFSALLEQLQCGSMRYHAKDDLQFGQRWNTGVNYAQGWSAVIWASQTRCMSRRWRPDSTNSTCVHSKSTRLSARTARTTGR